MKILVTGTAGFIGHASAVKLLAHGNTVIGLDNLNDYYDVSLKKARLRQLQQQANFRFLKLDITEHEALLQLFQQETFDCVLHLAAQAGVRHSITAPHSYIAANINGFMAILEACRHYPVKHLVYASSSSVYGANTLQPFSEQHPVAHPVSLYAATKKSNELMAHSYAHLYHIPVTGLRFFTVYGPWGRPDMALFKFTQAILDDKPIPLYNNGNMIRDFTYIDDIVEGIYRTLIQPATPDPTWDSNAPNLSKSSAPYRLYNIGNHHPVTLEHFVNALESALGRKAQRQYLPMQPGDVTSTCADVTQLIADTGYQPNTPIEQGIQAFVDWYCGSYLSLEKA